jgi:integrase
MIEPQQLTGMRPGEVTIMRTCDLDTSGRVWVYIPSHHKTAYHGHSRQIYLGLRAQAVLLGHQRLGNWLRSGSILPRSLAMATRK